jgi:predicted dehydrogenase
MKPLRVVLAGAGSMGQAWLAAIAADPGVELAGVVDLDVAAARAAAGPDLPVGTDVVEVARTAGAEAVINVTVPAAHHPITTAALFAGLPVLGEKPVADTVAQALSLAAASEVTGKLFMVSQSRRWNPQLFRLRELAARLGPIGTVTTDFFRAPHFGGFRDEMPYPLLVDMAIHQFDAIRYLLDAEPVSVYCESYNPSWSWFAGDAAATAIFEMSTGARYTFTGSWCAPGPETSWNGSWRVSGATGSAFWDGDTDPSAPGLPAPAPAPAPAPPSHQPPSSDRLLPSPADLSGISGALVVFADALRTGRTPSGEVHENLRSLAMVEAAIQSSRIGAPVRLADALEQAHRAAVRDELRPEVRAALIANPPHSKPRRT